MLSGSGRAYSYVSCEVKILCATLGTSRCVTYRGQSNINGPCPPWFRTLCTSTPQTSTLSYPGAEPCDLVALILGQLMNILTEDVDPECCLMRRWIDYDVFSEARRGTHFSAPFPRPIDIRAAQHPVTQDSARKTGEAAGLVANGNAPFSRLSHVHENGRTDSVQPAIWRNATRHPKSMSLF